MKINLKIFYFLCLLSIPVFVFLPLKETHRPVRNPISGYKFHNRSNVVTLKGPRTTANANVTRKRAAIESAKIFDKEDLFVLNATKGAGNQSATILDKGHLFVLNTNIQSKSTINYSSSGLRMTVKNSSRAGTMRDMLIASRERLDIMKLKPFKILPKYKNPCWKTKSTKLGIACLPYFYLVGAPKAGTTDVFRRLQAHPEYTAPLVKEPHWLTRIRFTRHERSDILEYAYHYFGKAAAEIYKWRDGAGYHRKITGDCSASTLWDNYNWRLLPHNARLQEPERTNADYIHHIFPETRIIVMLREPVSRLYSDFLYFHRNDTQSTFHTAVKRAIALLNLCLKKRSLRSCVYDKNIEKRLLKPRARILIGIYHVHLQEYIRVFPRDQILVLKLEDYSKNPEIAMKRIFQFLGLSKSRSLNLNLLTDASRHANERHRDDKAKGPMWTTTRDLLRKFYKPYNDALAALLNDRSLNYNDLYT